MAKSKPVKIVEDGRSCVNCVHHKAGECRRYPPAVCMLEDGPVTCFPCVDENDLCGEYRAAN